MKAYTYSPQEIGLNEWPSGTLRLEGTEPVTDPKQADVFICPGPLMLFRNPLDLDRFPYMKGNEERHIFFDVSDYDTLYSKPSIFIRCNTRTWYYKTDPNTIAWPWPVDDYTECLGVTGFKYDVSFQGWLSSAARIDSVNACKGLRVITSDIATYKDFTGYIWDTPEGLRRRQEFRRSMKESRVALCPESIPGVLPYRFFEAMSAGRIPLLVGEYYCLPFADEIPYQDFILTTNNPAQAGNIVRSFVRSHPDTYIAELGLRARRYYDRFLHRDLWPTNMTYAVKKKLGVLCG